MSVTLQLYQNTSDTNVLSKYLSAIGDEITGVLKESTSILKPVIKIEGSVPTNCNYFYISEFGRYYYIDDITVITSNIYQISGHVDVLKTYASQIRASSGIIARQESDWNLYLDDGSFKVYNNPIFKIEQFTNGSSFDSLHFILAVAGNS